MIIKLIFAILVIIALSYLYNRFRQQAPDKRKQISLKAVLYTMAGILLLLIATGRVHWITAIFAAVVPFLSRLVPLAFRLLPFVRHWQRHGRSSILQTAYLRLQLDQNSGAMQGQVISGLHAGKALDDLNSEALDELLAYYQTHDPESFRLLQAYLQQGNSRSGGTSEEPKNSGNMSRREALEILGLDDNASPTDIQQAHKKLMQRLHPDRGGSNYLAAKVNQAKSVLMKR